MGRVPVTGVVAPTVPLTGLVDAAGVATATDFETTTVEVMPLADVMTLVLVTMRVAGPA